MENIKLVASKLNLNEEDLFCYGNYKAKIENINTNRNGKLILVTSTNPTPYGEGKTTLSIGLCDSLNKLGYLSVADLREPYRLFRCHKSGQEPPVVNVGHSLKLWNDKNLI